MTTFPRSHFARLLSAICLVITVITASAAERPWVHGQLKVSANNRFLCHSDGTPFFWLGDTGWLLPQRLDRDEAARYQRLLATRGSDWLMVYNHTSRPMNLDLSRISGSGKHIWLMNPADGSLLYIGTHSGSHLTIDPRKIPGAPPLFLLCPTGHPLCHKYNKHTTRQNPQLTYFNYSGG